MGPLVGAAIASGVGDLLGQGINAGLTGATNKASRRYNTYMYDRQRADALSDYTMQNAYNSPTSQMARLREAGLNPNLVYGNGATAQGGIVRSSSAGGWNPKPPQFDLGNPISKYFDTKIQQATYDNLKAQNTSIIQEGLLKAAQVRDATASADTKEFDLKFKSDIREVSMDAVRANLHNVEAQTKVTLDRNEREAAMFAPNFVKAVEEIASIRAQRANTIEEKNEIKARVANLKRDGTLKDYEIKLNEMGIQKNDPAYMRLIIQAVGKLFGGSTGAEKATRKTRNWIKDEVGLPH